MIKEIQFNEHNVLGNLLLDFKKDDGTPYETVLLVGENGVGKTNVLDFVSNFLNKSSGKEISYIKYDILGKEYILDWDEKRTTILKHSIKNQNGDTMDYKNKEVDIREYGCVYSKSRTGFNTKTVQSTTSLELDNEKIDLDASDDFTIVKQLLIDISEQDNTEYVKLVKDNGGIYNYKDFEKKSKLFRFKNAFNNFFNNIGLSEVIVKKNAKTITFTKDKKTIDIDNLSTGEKQIIFRGAKLLKNINNIKNGIVLIDKPELSMHPKWQEKIFDFYRNLFMDESGNQMVQLIFASHSEYVLSSALENKNNTLVINLYEQNGIISSRKITAPFVLPTITLAEINYFVFNVASIDYHIQLYGELQNIFNTERIYDCDNRILNHRLYDVAQYEKRYNVNSHSYITLPTYIRNCIDHPNLSTSYTKDELMKSIKFMIEIIKDEKNVVI